MKINNILQRELRIFNALGSFRWLLLILPLLLANAIVRQSLIGIVLQSVALLIWRWIAKNRLEHEERMEDFRQMHEENMRRLYEMLEDSLGGIQTDKWRALPSEAKQKILKVRNMTSSDYEGERNAAQEKLNGLLSKHGITINDIPPRK